MYDYYSAVNIVEYISRPLILILFKSLSVINFLFDNLNLSFFVKKYSTSIEAVSAIAIAFFAWVTYKLQQNQRKEEVLKIRAYLTINNLAAFPDGKYKFSIVNRGDTPAYNIRYEMKAFEGNEVSKTFIRNKSSVVSIFLPRNEASFIMGEFSNVSTIINFLHAKSSNKLGLYIEYADYTEQKNQVRVFFTIDEIKKEGGTPLPILEQTICQIKEYTIAK